MTTKLLPHKWPQLPISVTLFGMGLAFGFMFDAESVCEDNALLCASTIEWAGTHPHTILFIFLPPLLFEAAYKMNWHVFKKVFLSSWLLAFPGVFLSLLLIGSGTKWLILPKWDWERCFLLGSILSATDPVAVVAVLHTLGAPKQLSTLIEGESLLNDGSAYVMFLVFLDLVTGLRDCPVS